MIWGQWMLTILSATKVRSLGGVKESTGVSQAWFLFCGMLRPCILMVYYIHVHPCNHQQLTVYKASNPPEAPKCSSPLPSYLLNGHLQSTKPGSVCLWSDHEVASDGLAGLPLVVSD